MTKGLRRIETQNPQRWNCAGDARNREQRQGNSHKGRRIARLNSPDQVAHHIGQSPGKRSKKTDWENRAHFYVSAARTMRRILVDYARTASALKRPGHQQRVEMSNVLALVRDRSHEFVALDEALERLAGWDARQAQIVELRFFGGLTVEETAAALGISEKTVKRDWSSARAWLQAQVNGVVS